jgi:hypothetical protein
MPAARPTQSLIDRSIAAWKANGLEVGSIEVRPDGTIRIFAPDATDAVASAPKGETQWGKAIRERREKKARGAA